MRSAQPDPKKKTLRYRRRWRVEQLLAWMMRFRRVVAFATTITQWGHVFGDEVIAAAILDRVLHHSHVVLIQGDSFRLGNKKRAGLLSSVENNPLTHAKGDAFNPETACVEPVP